jgi:hypothetical protein
LLSLPALPRDEMAVRMYFTKATFAGRLPHVSIGWPTKSAAAQLGSFAAGLVCGKLLMDEPAGLICAQ